MVRACTVVCKSRCAVFLPGRCPLPEVQTKSCNEPMSEQCFPLLCWCARKRCVTPPTDAHEFRHWEVSRVLSLFACARSSHVSRRISCPPSRQTRFGPHDNCLNVCEVLDMDTGSWWETTCRGGPRLMDMSMDCSSVTEWMVGSCPPIMWSQFCIVVRSVIRLCSLHEMTLDALLYVSML